MVALSIDIFCRVVDNYGDIGVCWRFCQQLHHDHGCTVRLVVDDFDSFAKLCPTLDKTARTQMQNGISIIKWNDALSNTDYPAPAHAVIEAFACHLPDFVVTQMVAHNSVWIDLEYLSAEDWVEGCHAIPSFHPATGLQKTLFFPGFTPKTGGLFRERDLITTRNAFIADTTAQNAWRAQYGLPAKAPNTLDISLFCYNDAPIHDLFAAINRSATPVRLFVTSGQAQDAVTAAGYSQHPAIHTLPFVPQPEYDRLLWTMDANFVRGEDSFLRAIWAGKPFMWHIYRQADNAHMAKLNAFLARYLPVFSPNHAEILEHFAILWNERTRINVELPDSDVPDYFSHIQAMLPAANSFCETLIKQDDLASQLIRFIRQATPQA